jgi:hypothetical protein
VELAAVENALEALETRGAFAFDAAGCQCVRQLVARAKTLDARAAALLACRANVHLERLSERFDNAQRDTEHKLARVEASHGALPRERATLEHGDLHALRRRLRHLEVVPQLPRSTEDTARERGRRSNEYSAAAADLVTAVALARATDIVPRHAGPYNPLRIASDLLARMRIVSPIYLTAQLKRLDELSSMLMLPELPEPPHKAPPPRKRAPVRSSRGARMSRPERPRPASPRKR